MIFFFKQKTAYEMRISDWSSDVCSSDLYASTPSAARRATTTIPTSRWPTGTAPTVCSARAESPVGGRSAALPARQILALGFGEFLDRKSVVKGTRVSVRVDLGGRRIIQKKIRITHLNSTVTNTSIYI